MIDFGPIIAAIGFVRDLAPALIHERDRQKAAAIEIQLAEKIAQAQMQLLDVVNAASKQADALHRAQERIRQLEADQRERERYQLVQLPDCRGIFGYGLRPPAELGERSAEPMHFLCQSCFDGGRKAVLHPGSVYGSRTWSCPLCKTELTGDPVLDT